MCQQLVKKMRTAILKHLLSMCERILYWWEFEYPDLGIVTSQDLVIPTDEKVYFQLWAADVKHSFWIPATWRKD